MNCSYNDQDTVDSLLLLSYYTYDTTQICAWTYNAFTESYESTLLRDMGEGVTLLLPMTARPSAQSLPPRSSRSSPPRLQTFAS